MSPVCVTSLSTVFRMFHVDTPCMSFTGTSVRDKFATIRKTPPSDAVRRIMVDKLQLEYEFYFFVRRRFEQYYINMKRNERSNKASRSFMNDDIAIMDFA